MSSISEMVIQNAPLKFSKLFSVVLFAERKSIVLIFSSEEDLFQFRESQRREKVGILQTFL